MIRSTLVAVSATMLLAGCGTGGLPSLLLEGPEIHPSLRTARIDDVPHLHVPRAALQGNPQFSTDAQFVGTIARAGSQGQLDGAGIRAALYALYGGAGEIGIYGLEAASREEADRRESLLRGIWAHNVSVERARVHRGGHLVVVVWHDGACADCWEAVNAAVARRLPPAGAAVGLTATADS